MKLFNKNTAFCLTALFCSSSMFGMLRLPATQRIEDSPQGRTTFETHRAYVNLHATPTHQNRAPQQVATMPSPTFWMQQFPDFNYRTSPVAESPILPRTLVSPAQTANSTSPIFPASLYSPVRPTAQQAPNTHQALLRYAALRAAACGRATLSPWLSSPAPVALPNTYYFSPASPAHTNPAYAALRAAHNVPAQHTSPVALNLLPVQQGPSQGTQWIQQRPNRYLVAAAAAPQATSTPARHPIFALTALDARTREMIAEISADENAFWNQSIGTMEKQVAFAKNILSNTPDKK